MIDEIRCCVCGQLIGARDTEDDREEWEEDADRANQLCGPCSVMEKGDEDDNACRH